jgi:carboxyl-terminal processing protease
MRQGKTLDLPLTRGAVPLPSIEASFMVEPGIGYIRISKFAETTYKEFMDAATTLQKQGMQKMILDLRGNGGGLLDEATKIADELLVDDKLLVTVKGSRVKTKEVRSSKPGLFEEGDLVLLADEFSASASEVLAGALQDNDRGTIVGRRTFGKGLVQEQYDLENGGALRLTVARYYTPTGRSIQKPYNANHSQYRNEVMERYHQAGSTSAVPDSSGIRSYKTKGGKTLYDGGGITPDISVALDTNQFSAAMMAVTSGNAAETATFLWYLRNRAKVDSFKTADDFYLSAMPDSAIWSSVNKELANDTVRESKINIAEKAAVENRLKAMMARYRWRNNGFYKLLLKSDDTFLKGLEVIKNAAK